MQENKRKSGVADLTTSAEQGREREKKGGQAATRRSSEKEAAI